MYTGVGETNEARHDRVTQPCAPTRPKNTGMGRMSDAPKFKIYETHGYTMSSSRGKKTIVPASKKRKGAVSSSGSTAKICHPFFQVPLGPQEELYQILRARPLGVGRYIDWVALEHIHLADAVRALLTTDPWGLFFEIVELKYLEFTLELCSMFHLQTVMTTFDDPGML
ncbi:hypothetical protein PVK06_022963 [Gossypium arboreum]|uniref:Uncharacterized protein n=1 Tax=Gossypium arboreum TaxID=29729 RepID=A0ABR0P9T5_GOSAR|nr:hypothetical protein PVK06_022963 [Gossypium arboreum]